MWTILIEGNELRLAISNARSGSDDPFVYEVGGQDHVRKRCVLCEVSDVARDEGDSNCYRLPDDVISQVASSVGDDFDADDDDPSGADMASENLEASTASGRALRRSTRYGAEYVT